jgi:hypothetical protein
MTELTLKSPNCIVAKITVTKDRVPVENWQVYPIRKEHRQAVDSLGTFLPSRASDLLPDHLLQEYTKGSPSFFTTILMAMRFLPPKHLVVLPIFQGRPPRYRHRQHNPLQYRRISTRLDTHCKP